MRAFLYPLIAAFFWILALTSANAANYQGFVTNIAPYNDKVYVLLRSGGFDGESSNCSQSGPAMVYGFDPGSAIGKALMATALAAKLSGKLVYAVGDGTCASGSPYPPNQQYEGLTGMDLKG